MFIFYSHDIRELGWGVHSVLVYGEFEVFKWDWEVSGGPYYSLRQRGEDADKAIGGGKEVLELCKALGIPMAVIEPSLFFQMHLNDILGSIDI